VTKERLIAELLFDLFQTRGWKYGKDEDGTSEQNPYLPADRGEYRLTSERNESSTAVKEKVHEGRRA